MLRACIYATLLCTFFGVVADTRAQSKTQVCDALDMSTADCALITGVSTTLPSGVTLPLGGCCPSVATAVPWYVSPVKTEGDNSLRSGNVGNRRASCLVLAVSLPDTRQLRFSLRTSSEGQHDRLAFFVDDQTVIENFSAPEGSETRDWQQLGNIVTNSVSNLSWCYIKNTRTRAADDSGWLDNLSFIPLSPICPILDMSDEECALITATSYDPSGSAWTANTIATEGTNSLRSRGVSSSQQSCLILNVSLPDRTLVQFSRRVNSQPADELYFSIDDVRQEYSLRPAATTVLRDWSREVHILFESGDKVLSWCYVKDGSGTEGADRAWIDDLSLIAPPAAPLNRDVVCLVLDMSLEDCELITSYAPVPSDPSWHISYLADRGRTSLRSNSDIDDNRFSCLVLGVTLPADTRIGFAPRSDSEGGRDFLYFEADGVRLIENYSAPLGSSLRDFDPLEFEVTNPVSELRWCYQKDAILSLGDDSVWLDRLYFNSGVDEAVSSVAQACLALDLIDQECTQIRRVSFDPPELPWLISSIATEGDTSLRSPDIGDSQQSCLELHRVLDRESSVQFSQRASSQPADRLLVASVTVSGPLSALDLLRPVADTVLRDWSREWLVLQANSSILRWCYAKDGSTSEGEDSVWIDDLSFFLRSNEAIVSREQVCQVLDMSAEDCALIAGFSTTVPNGLTLPPPASNLPGMSTPGDVPWFVTVVNRQGGNSLRSGSINDSEASCLVLAVSLPAGTVIRFSLRTSSEGVLDRLTFAADTQVLIENFSAPVNSATRDWEPLEHTVTNRVSNLSWCYLKNNRTSLGQDTGLLDALSFTTVTPICEVLDMSADDCVLISSVSTTLPSGLALPRTAFQIRNASASIPGDVPWFVSPVARQGDSSLRSGNISLNAASCLVLTVTLPANTAIRFSLRTSSEGPDDRLVFAANTEILIENFSATAPQALREWEQQEFMPTNSISKLSWCYLKDVSTNRGEDSGWLDTLSFIPQPPRGDPLTRELVCLVLDMSSEDCALITHIGSDPAAPPWYISNFNSEGSNSLRSGNIDHNETSCLVLGVALPGDRTIRFFLRTDSEGANDFLYFDADGARLIRNFSAPSSSSLRDFGAVNVFLAGDISKLAWCYTKNGSGNAGDDSGWLDRLSLSAAGARTTIALTPGLVCQALDLSTDNCALIDSVAADPPERPWVLSAIATEGSLSLRSGDIDNSQTSCLVLGITLPGDRSLRFSLRTDSEAVNDFLYFEADGTRLVDRFSAPQGSTVRDWEQTDILISESISTLTWCYTKNGSTSAGEDSGWLDALTFTVSGLTRDPLCPALDMSDDDCALISSVSTILPPDLILVQQPVDVPWTVAMTVDNQGGSSLQSGDTDHSEASCLVLGVTLPINTVIRFSLRTSSQGLLDHLTFAADSQTVIENFSAAEGGNLMNWQQQEYTATNGVSNLSWCYQKSRDTDGGSDAGWLDTLSFALPASLSTTQLCTALDLSADNCSQIQSVSADPPFFPWRVTMDTSVAGGSSLRSADIDDGGQSCLVLDLSLSANSVITLASRTSSQGGFDQLQVSADQTRLDTLSAAISSTEKPWGHTTYYLPTAATALRWCYVKDSADSSGEDSAWIDNLSFSASDISYKIRICDVLDLPEAICSMATNITYGPSNFLWVITSQTSVSGGTSLRSPDLNDNQEFCLSISVLLPANTLIRFSLLVDSEAVNDFLFFEADNITGEQVVNTFNNGKSGKLNDWEQLNFRISNNIDVLGWCYRKNGSISSGADAGWIDALSITVPVQLSTTQLCTALDLSIDNCSQIQSVSADPPSFQWRIATDTSVAGGSSLRSADIDDGGQSCLVLGLSLSANSVISLASRTSSHGGFDQLQISADQTRLDTLSAAIGTTEKPWAHTTYYLPAAATTLRWCYVKDSADSDGEDRVWIDNLSFSASDISYKSRICASLDLAEAICSMVTDINNSPNNALWVITSQTSVSGGTSLRSPDVNDNQEFCLSISVLLPANTLIRFSLLVDSEAVNDFLFFEADNITGDQVVSTFTNGKSGKLNDWEQLNFLISNNITVLGWCYRKNGSISSGADAVWLDALSINIPLTTEDVCLALDLSTQECAMITGVAADPPQSLWQISPIATESSTSLRSGDIDDDQQSCLVLNLSPLTERTLVQFSLRISSEPLADRLLFAADGQFLGYNLRPEPNTVLRDWSRQLSIVPAGTTSLSWCYRKDDMTSMGEDSVWIDDLSITSTTVVVLDRELVCLVLDINTEGCGIIRSVAFDPPASPWLIATTATEGDFSLRSGDIDDSESSCLVLGITLSVDRGIRFSLRTDSEAVNDHLSFEAGGQELIETFAAAEDSTLRDWEPQQFLLPAGDSMLRWCYNKNDSTSSGADSGWLDALSYVSAGLVQFEPLCDALDLFEGQCANIRAVTYEPPQSLWLSTATESARGGSALVSPALNTGESSCLTVEFHSPLTPDSPVAFDWRTTSQSGQDILQFQVGDQQGQIANMPEWQTETVILDSAESTLRWCYNRNSAADGQTARAWLDNLSVLTLTDRYTVQIAVIPTSLLVTEDLDGFQFQVTVTAASETLPPPADWVLVIAGMDNITAADTTYALVFADGAAQVDAIATSDDPLLPSSILLSLEDRPSLLNTITGTSLAFQLPAVRRLETLEIITSASVTQSAPDAMIMIAVTVAATDNFGEPLDLTGLTLMVEDSGNAEVSQSNYALSFTDGSAAISITVGLTRRGDVGRIELSVASGDIQSAVSITLNPAPRVLASITLSAASSKLVQTTANTAVSAVLMLAALDNYGDPIEAGDVNLQIEATNAAIVTPSFTVAIATTATALQMIEILPQNELDTTVTVSISRGALDESVQLLPDGGIQIAVRVLRVLRQLQLSLVDQVSPLRQIDRTLPIRANIRLNGLDQFGQPIAFPEVMLTAAAEPTETTAVLEPPQLTATEPEGAVTVLIVTFPESSSPVATMITIEIEAPDTGVSTNSLVVQALPDLRDPLRPLHVDATETGVTELDLIVALRWLIDQQGDNNAALVVNLTIPSADITTAGIDNLRQLFTDPANLDRIDLNRDGRADQLDLRILLRYVAGLRGAELAEQDVFEDLIRRLLNR